MALRKRMVRLKSPIVHITPRLRAALKLLLAGDRLEFNATPIGRPTKQRLAKYGLARYTGGARKNWDGPMVITDKGKALAEEFRL